MKDPKIFENINLTIHEENVFANRKQLQELYKISKKTLANTINNLRQERLVVGKIFRHKSGIYCEFYNLDEIISIGFHLKSKVAIQFQRWANETTQNELIKAREKLKMQQMQLDYFWDKQDSKDLY